MRHVQLRGERGGSFFGMVGWAGSLILYSDMAFSRAGAEVEACQILHAPPWRGPTASQQAASSQFSPRMDPRLRKPQPVSLLTLAWHPVRPNCSCKHMPLTPVEPSRSASGQRSAQLPEKLGHLKTAFNQQACVQQGALCDICRFLLVFGLMLHDFAALCTCLALQASGMLFAHNLTLFSVTVARR